MVHISTHCTKNSSDYTQSLAELQLLWKGHTTSAITFTSVPKHFREKHGLPTTSYTCAGAYVSGDTFTKPISLE
jgi:hypothetical protein